MDIDLVNVKAIYNMHKEVLKQEAIPKYMPREGRKPLPIPKEMYPPFSLEAFHNYLKYTDHGLHKVLGVDRGNIVINDGHEHSASPCEKGV